MLHVIETSTKWGKSKERLDLYACMLKLTNDLMLHVKKDDALLTRFHFYVRINDKDLNFV
jgi:hypothetical protein